MIWGFAFLRQFSMLSSFFYLTITKYSTWSLLWVVFLCASLFKKNTSNFRHFAGMASLILKPVRFDKKDNFFKFLVRVLLSPKTSMVIFVMGKCVLNFRSCDWYFPGFLYVLIYGLMLKLMNTSDQGVVLMNAGNLVFYFQLLPSISQMWMPRAENFSPWQFMEERSPWLSCQNCITHWCEFWFMH